MALPCGMYSVGYADFSYCAQSESSGSAEVEPEKHVVGALFYPASKASNKSAKRTRSVRWVPEYKYAKGFAVFIGVPLTWQRPFMKVLWLLLGPCVAAFAYAVGHAKKLPATKGLQLAQRRDPFPIIILSHGVGGNRMVQSYICCELASQGFVVMSLEHADGSASAVHLAGARPSPWLYFRALPDASEREQRILHRMQEMRTAVRLLTAADAGEAVPGLAFRDAPEHFLASLGGRLDTSCIAAVGHSFGGGPSCALPLSGDSGFKCGVGMDPYWPSVPASHAVFHGARAASPLLLIGCQSWNDPAEKSYLKTDFEREKAVLQAASRKSGGGGTIALVLRGMGHASFTDAEMLMGSFTPKFMRGGPKDALSPEVVILLLQQLITTFLRDHLPLSDSQRQAIKPQRLGQERAHSSGRQATSKAEAAPASTTGEELGAAVAASEEAVLAAEPEANGTTPAAETPDHGARAKSAHYGRGVEAEEEAMYRDIVGRANVYSLRVVP